MSDYLPITKFDGNEMGYQVEVTGDGCTVYSECCADTMSRETAARLHAALGEYLAATE